MRYIDDDQRSPAQPVIATDIRFLSGEVAWRDAPFGYPGSGSVDIEWCYIKDGSVNSGEDAGFLDQLQIIPSSINLKVRVYPEGALQ